MKVSKSTFWGVAFVLILLLMGATEYLITL